VGKSIDVCAPPGFVANWVASGLLLCEYRYDATHAAKQKNVRILRRIQPSKLDITNISLAEKLP